MSLTLRGFVNLFGEFSPLCATPFSSKCPKILFFQIHVPGYMEFCFFFKSMYLGTWNFFFFKSMYMNLSCTADRLHCMLIAPILILMTEKWATEQSCIHIKITSCKIPSLKLVVQRVFNIP